MKYSSVILYSKLIANKLREYLGLTQIFTFLYHFILCNLES